MDGREGYFIGLKSQRDHGIRKCIDEFGFIIGDRVAIGEINDEHLY